MIKKLTAKDLDEDPDGCLGGGGGDVGDQKQKCPAWGGWIFFGTTH